MSNWSDGKDHVIKGDGSGVVLWWKESTRRNEEGSVRVGGSGFSHEIELSGGDW